MSNQQEKDAIRTNRSLKILRNLSEFLKILDVKEGAILKSMLVKFSLEAIDADRGALLTYDPVDESLSYFTAYITTQTRQHTEDYTKELDGVRFNKGIGLAGICLKENEPILCSDTKEDPRFLKEPDELLPVRSASMICLPITVENEPIAVLEIANSEGSRPLDETDLEILTIITNLSSAAMENAQLLLWAISDPLTRLFNIQYFRRSLEAEIKRTERYQDQFSVVMVDLDNFKAVNDTYGHGMGDKVLLAIADSFRNNLRKEVDTACRYGGDEFILLLPNTGKEGARTVMQRIVRLASEKKFRTKQGDSVSITISVGVAVFPDDANTSKKICEKADEALYKAKNNGKNMVAFL